MKNHKVVFYFESIFVLGLLYLFFYASFSQHLGDAFLRVASITIPILRLVIFVSFVMGIILNGFQFKNLVKLADDEKNPAGIIIRYFGCYLILSLLPNLIILGIYGEESEFANNLLFNINFVLLAPFAMIGVLKGFLAARKI